MRRLLALLRLLCIVRGVPRVGIEVLTLGPHDLLVLSYEQHLRRETVDRIVSTMAQLIDGQRSRVVVLDGGAKLGVLRRRGGPD